VLESIRNNAQGERLNSRLRLCRRPTVCEHAGQVEDLRYPAAVAFLLEFDSDGHGRPSTYHS